MKSITKNHRSILITGGSGYFGKGFLQAALGKGAVRVCIYSRCEHRQAAMRSEFGDDRRIRWFVGDVRDAARLRQAMEGVELVVHAAALKRIEVVTYNPMEAVSTNVLGSENVVKAAIDAHVGRAVLLSTDKACNPTTTYGLTKAVAERLFLQAEPYATPFGTKFAVCRYGNVSGSTGSVIPIWRRLIADGETVVPITDPECTRFWMTAKDAVDLVMGTIETMQGGELVIPTLPAYRLIDLATALGATGTRPMAMAENEKMHEEMSPGQPSDQARRMSVDELREALVHV